MRKKTASFCFLCVCLLLSTAMSGFVREEQSSKKMGVLSEIKISDAPDVLEVKLVIEAYSFHRVFQLVQPARIVVDLYNIGDILAEPVLEINGHRVIRIRHGMFQRGVARVVFDVEENVPFYGIQRISEGLKITFSSQKETPPVAAAKVAAKAEAQEKKPVLVPEETPPDKTEEQTKELLEALTAIESELEETKKKLDETISQLNQLTEERLKQKKKFIRVLVTGHYYSPTDGNLKSKYREGQLFGAEMNVGVTDFIEIWFAEHYLSKTVVDTVADTVDRIRLIPFELGLKVRLNKGVVNPYFGIGGGYFQYSEKSFEGEYREQNIGFIGQTGLFIKLGGFFVVDIKAQFKYCPITTAIEKFDIGGFHFGAGLGFEF